MAEFIASVVRLLVRTSGLRVEPLHKNQFRETAKRIFCVFLHCGHSAYQQSTIALPRYCVCALARHRFVGVLHGEQKCFSMMACSKGTPGNGMTSDSVTALISRMPINALNLTSSSAWSHRAASKACRAAATSKLSSFRLPISESLLHSALAFSRSFAASEA